MHCRIPSYRSLPTGYRTFVKAFPMSIPSFLSVLSSSCRNRSFSEFFCNIDLFKILWIDKLPGIILDAAICDGGCPDRQARGNDDSCPSHFHIWFLSVLPTFGDSRWWHNLIPFQNSKGRQKSDIFRRDDFGLESKPTIAIQTTPIADYGVHSAISDHQSRH